MVDNVNKTEKNKTEGKSLGKDYIYAIGRRKSSSALVRLYKKDLVGENLNIKKGEIFVNNKKAEEYFGEMAEKLYKEPLIVTNTENKFAISVKVRGGGKKGQIDATVLALARALDKVDKEKFHVSLKKKSLLTRDARVRQRRKVGMGGKSRRSKQSPKR